MNNYSAKELQRALDHADKARNHYELTIESMRENHSANTGQGLAALDVFEQAKKITQTHQ